MDPSNKSSSRRFSLQVETSSRSLFSLSHHHRSDTHSTLPVLDSLDDDTALSPSPSPPASTSKNSVTSDSSSSFSSLSSSSSSAGGNAEALPSLSRPSSLPRGTSIDKPTLEKIRTIVKQHPTLLEQLRNNATLNVDASVGLESDEAVRRFNVDGPNELPKDPPKRIIDMLIEQFTSVLVLMLLASCVISMLTGQFAASLTIIIIVLFNAILGVMQESKAGVALDALESLSAPTAQVIRDGVRVPITIPSSQLVVGDIVVVELGCKVPADLLLLDSLDLLVNEMALTGESEPVKKEAEIHHIEGLPELLKKSTKKTDNENTTTSLPSSSASSSSTSSSDSSATVAPSCSSKEELTDSRVVYMGCPVVSGRGRGVVIKTGLHTMMGEIANQIAEADAGQSPLQTKLGDLGVQLGIASMAVSAVVFLLGVLTGRGADPSSDTPVWLQMMLIAVSLTVAAVPEGLPTCVTITLAVGMQNMVKKHALIRNLHSVETLGSADVICTDKTGTLTAGCMTMTRMFYAAEGVGPSPHAHAGVYVISGVGYSTTGQLYKSDAGEGSALPIDFNDDALNVGPRLPIIAAALCSNAVIEEEEVESTENDSKPPKKKTKVTGNSSDKPVVVASEKIGWSEARRHKLFRKIAENPFNSTNKCMSVLVDPLSAVASSLFPPSLSTSSSDSRLVIVKGAPDVLLKKCVNIIDSSCSSSTPSSSASSSSLSVRSFTESDAQKLEEVIQSFSSDALRVMAVCYRRASPHSSSCSSSIPLELEQELTFVGLLASIDPEREEVASSIATAAAAGIRTVMITGDFIATAVAIAKRVGILPHDYQQPSASSSTSSSAGASATPVKAIDCAQLRALSQQLQHVEDELSAGIHNHTLDRTHKHALVSAKREWEHKIDAVTAVVDVYSRAYPIDKITIVRSLQRQGHVVAMTGDGVNDAPALKQANIGVAMGITGTDVAKAASDMVLTDDNFVSIVAAIEQGRTIYANIVKFVYYLLSTNVSEVLLILLAVLMGMQCPLLPIQILWLNLATDGAPAIALALEKQEPGLMLDGPRKLAEPLMDYVMYTGIVIQSVALTSVTLGAYMLGLKDNVGNWYGVKPVDMMDEAYEDAVSGARTMCILLIVFAELLRAYTCRTLRVSIFEVGVFSNHWMQLSVFVSVAFTLLFATVPFFMEIFSMTTLTRRQWLIVLLFSLIPVTVDELTKIVYRRTGFGLRPKLRAATTATTTVASSTKKYD